MVCSQADGRNDSFFDVEIEMWRIICQTVFYHSG